MEGGWRGGGGGGAGEDNNSLTQQHGHRETRKNVRLKWHAVGKEESHWHYRTLTLNNK